MRPAPLSLWHCDPELCSIEKRFNWKDGPFHGRPTPLKVNGANFSTLLPPQGCKLLPILKVWSYRACQPLQMWPISHFCEIHSLSYEASIFFAMLSQWGNFWDAPAPQGCNFYPILRCGLTEPASLFKLWQISNFCEIHSLSYEASKFFAMLRSMRLNLPLFCPWGKHRTPRSLIKVIAQ